MQFVFNLQTRKTKQVFHIGTARRHNGAAIVFRCTGDVGLSRPLNYKVVLPEVLEITGVANTFKEQRYEKSARCVRPAVTFAAMTSTWVGTRHPMTSRADTSFLGMALARHVYARHNYYLHQLQQTCSRNQEWARSSFLRKAKPLRGYFGIPSPVML